MISALTMLLMIHLSEPIDNALKLVAIQNDPLIGVCDDLFDGELSNSQLLDFVMVMRHYGEDYAGLDANWLLALAYHESRFNTEAYRRNTNGTNDVGLYQHNSRYWNRRLRMAIDEYTLLYGGFIWERVNKDRRDPVCALVVTISHLKNNVANYRLHGINVYLSHYGVGWATNLRNRSNAIGYRRALIRAYDEILSRRQRDF